MDSEEENRFWERVDSVKRVFVESCICDIDQLVIWATKNNDLVLEFKGEGCHRTAKSQDNYTSVNSSGAHVPPGH